MARDVVRTVSTELKIKGEGEYKNAVKNIKSETALLDAQLKELETRYADNAKSAEYLAKKKELLAQKSEVLKKKQETEDAAVKNSTNAANAYKTKLEELKKELEKITREYSQGSKSQEEYEQRSKELVADIDALEKELSVANKRITSWRTESTKTQTELNKLDSSTKQTSQSVLEFERSADDAGDASEKMGNQIDKAATDLEGLLVAAGVTAGVDKLKDKMLEAEAASRQLKAAVAETKTLIDTDAVSQDVVDGLEDKVKKFAKEMNVLTSEVTPALYNSVSAGQSPEKVFGFLRTAQQAAVAGVTDINTAADGLTSIVNAYGEEVINAERTSDILFATVKKGKTTFGELSASVYQVVPTAASLRVPLEDIGAAFATITARGVPTATAATQLRQIFTELSTTGSKTDKVFREISGGSFKQFIASGHSLADALTLLEKHAESTGTEFSDMWSSVEARNAALNLTGKAAKDFASNLDVMRNSAGATSEAYKIMADTSEYSAKRLEVANESVSLAIGDALEPALRKARETGADVLECVAEYLEAHPEAVKALTVAVVTIGALTAGLAAAKVATLLFNSALMSSPAGLFAAGLAAAVGALTAVSLGASEAEEETHRLKETLDEVTSSTKQSVEAQEDRRNTSIAEIEILDELVNRYDELNSKETLSAQEKETLTEIVRELQGVYHDLDFQLDNTTGKYTILAGEIKSAREEMKKSIELEYERKIAETNYAAARELLNGLGYETIDDIVLQKNEAQNKANEYQGRYNSWANSYDGMDPIEYVFAYGGDILSGTVFAASDYADKASEYNRLAKKYQEYIDQYNEYMSVYNTWLDKFGIDNAPDNSTDTTNEVAENANAAATALDNYSKTVEKTAQKTDEYTNVLKRWKSEIDLCNKAVEEQNSNGQLSAETALSLISSNSKYAEAISVENGQIKLNTENAKNLLEIRKKIEVQTLAQAKEERRQSALTTIRVMEDEYAKLKAKADALKAAGKLTAEQEKELQWYYDGMMWHHNQAHKLRQEISADEEEYKRTVELINAFFDNYESGSGSATSATFNLEQSLSRIRSIISIVSKTLEEYNANGKTSIETAMQLINADERYIKALSIENGIVKLNTQLLKELTDSKKNEAAEDLRNAHNKGLIDTDTFKKGLDIINALAESAANAGSEADAAKESLAEFGDALTDALKNYYKELQDAEKEAVENSISRWENWKDSQVSAIEEQIYALDELQKKEEEESRSAELLRKAEQLEYEARFATDEYNRIELQKQAASARKEYEDYQKDLETEKTKESLKAQAEAAKKKAEDEIEKLKAQLTVIDEQYNSLTSETALQGEALKLIKSDSSGAILASLLGKYNPEFFNDADSFSNELASLVTGEYIAKVMSKAESRLSNLARNEQTTNITNANRTVRVENINIYPGSTGTVQQAKDITEQFLNELNKALN